MKIHKLSKSQTKIATLLAFCCLIIIVVVIVLNQRRDTYEISLKPLKETALIYKLHDKDSKERYWISVKKNGVDVVSSAFVGGNFPKDSFKVSEIESSEPNYLMTQTQYETVKAFKDDPVRAAAFHKSNVSEDKKRFQTIQYLDKDKKVLAEVKLAYIVIDDEIPKMPPKPIELKLAVDEVDSDHKIKAFMGAFKGGLADNSYTDKYTGKYDIKTPGKYTLSWERTLTRNGLKSKASISLTVEKKAAAVNQGAHLLYNDRNPKRASLRISSEHSNKKQIKNHAQKANKDPKDGTKQDLNKLKEQSASAYVSTNSKPNQTGPTGMLFHKNYGNSKACIAVMNAVATKHLDSWTSSFCDMDGSMFYTKNH